MKVYSQNINLKNITSMKKFLVPTDFSETSKNAARYAVELAQDDPETTIIYITPTINSLRVQTDRC